MTTNYLVSLSTRSLTHQTEENDPSEIHLVYCKTTQSPKITPMTGTTLCAIHHLHFANTVRPFHWPSIFHERIKQITLWIISTYSYIPGKMNTYHRQQFPVCHRWRGHDTFLQCLNKKSMDVSNLGIRLFQPNHQFLVSSAAPRKYRTTTRQDRVNLQAPRFMKSNKGWHRECLLSTKLCQTCYRDSSESETVENFQERGTRR